MFVSANIPAKPNRVPPGKWLPTPCFALRSLPLSQLVGPPSTFVRDPPVPDLQRLRMGQPSGRMTLFTPVHVWCPRFDSHFMHKVHGLGFHLIACFFSFSRLKLKLLYCLLSVGSSLRIFFSQPMNVTKTACYHQIHGKSASIFLTG